MRSSVLAWVCISLFLQNSVNGTIDKHGLQLDRLQRIAVATRIHQSPNIIMPQRPEGDIKSLTQLRDAQGRVPLHDEFYPSSPNPYLPGNASASLSGAIKRTKISVTPVIPSQI